MAPTSTTTPGASLTAAAGGHGRTETLLLPGTRAGAAVLSPASSLAHLSPGASSEAVGPGLRLTAAPAGMRGSIVRSESAPSGIAGASIVPIAESREPSETRSASPGGSEEGPGSDVPRVSNEGPPVARIASSPGRADARGDGDSPSRSPPMAHLPPGRPGRRRRRRPAPARAGAAGPRRPAAGRPGSRGAARGGAAAARRPEGRSAPRPPGRVRPGLAWGT